MNNSLIVALSTPLGFSAIAVVRLSGNGSHELACRLARKESLKIRRASLHKIYDQNDQLIDECLLLYFKAPASFSGEDLVEFHLHGNPLIVERLIGSCLYAGARMAEPGEFTRRAFLNGKLNLIEAEAIQDLIQAKSLKLINAAQNNISGQFKLKIDQLREKINAACAFGHGLLDFPIETEHEDLSSFYSLIEEVKSNWQRLLEISKSSGAAREGIKTVILGQPNAGKSSLLNLMLGSDRAIVSPEAGTTRDFIQETCLLGDIPLVLIDTAGLRHNYGLVAVETEGIERSLKQAAQAELILFLYDASAGWTEIDQRFLEQISEINQEALVLVIANKTDLIAKQHEDKHTSTKESKERIDFSCKTGDGLETIKKRIRKLWNFEQWQGDFELSVSQRQAGILRAGWEELNQLTQQPSLEAYVFHLEQLGEYLDQLENPLTPGLSNQEELLDDLFSTFCLGK